VSTPQERRAAWVQAQLARAKPLSEARRDFIRAQLAPVAIETATPLSARATRRRVRRPVLATAPPDAA